MHSSLPVIFSMRRRGTQLRSSMQLKEALIIGQLCPRNLSFQFTNTEHLRFVELSDLMPLFHSHLLPALETPNGKPCKCYCNDEYRNSDSQNDSDVDHLAIVRLSYELLRAPCWVCMSECATFEVAVLESDVVVGLRDLWVWELYVEPPLVMLEESVLEYSQQLTACPIDVTTPGGIRTILMRMELDSAMMKKQSGFVTGPEVRRCEQLVGE